MAKNYCCICMEQTSELTELQNFRNAYVCLKCKVSHFEMIEAGKDITKHYDFIRQVTNNLELIRQFNKK